MQVRKHDLAELLSRGARLRARIEQKKTYLRYVSHEIRTPLNSACLGINWLVDALASLHATEEVDDEVFEMAVDISTTLDIAVKVITDLMTLGKIEGGVNNMTLQPICLSPLFPHPTFPFIHPCLPYDKY